MQRPLLDTVLECVKELGRLSEEAWALVRAETEISAFYFLHQFAHIKLFTPSQVKRGPAGSSEDSGTLEATIAASLISRLVKMLESLRPACPSHALAIVFAPLAQLVPLVLIKCFSHLLMTHSSNRPTSIDSPEVCSRSLLYSQVLSLRLL